MKRTLAWLIAAALICIAVGDADAGVRRGKVKNLTFRTQAAASLPADSMTFSMNGAIGTTSTIDTTVAISTEDFDWGSGANATTAFNPLKLWIYSSSAPSGVDTVFVAMETSPDGINWVSNTTFVNALLVSGDQATSVSLPVDADAVANPFLAPVIRFRIRSDGNTAAVWANVKASLSYQSSQPLSP